MRTVSLWLRLQKANYEYHYLKALSKLSTDPHVAMRCSIASVLLKHRQQAWDDERLQRRYGF